MAAWAASPYRAIGVYIGGANRACSQPNLTSSWVSAAGRRRLAPDPDLRRPAGADEQLRQLRQAQRRPRAAQGRAAAATPSPRRAARSAIGPGQPDLLRHGGLLARPQRHSGHPHLPRGLDREAARARLRLRRLQQQRLRDRRPGRPGRHRLRRSPTTSGSPTGTASEHASTPTSRRRLDRAPAHPPVPRRPRRDLRRRDDQHRQQLRRRGDRRGTAPRPTTKTRSARSTWSAPPRPGQIRVKAGPSTPTHRPSRWRSAPTSAAGRGPGVASYELGPSPPAPT